MTARIDLDAYAEEVKAFSDLAENFVPRASTPGLKKMEQDLRTGISRASADWTWFTAQEIAFRSSGQYDALGKKPRPAHFTLSFECAFTRPANVNVKKAGAVWQVRHASTHIRVARDDGASLELHFDYKNAGQLGPQLHLQVAESQTRGLPIPRLASPAFLPTDCADIMLCELHPLEWERHQRAGNSQWNVAVLRNGQEHRTVAYLTDLHSQWKSDLKRTRFSTVQTYSAGITALPAHNGVSAKVGW